MQTEDLGKQGGAETLRTGLCLLGGGPDDQGDQFAHERLPRPTGAHEGGERCREHAHRTVPFTGTLRRQVLSPEPGLGTLLWGSRQRHAARCSGARLDLSTAHPHRPTIGGGGATAEAQLVDKVLAAEGDGA
jgi:hypothetical protein